ncbi:MAG: hypothetical protein AAB516_00610 [Patescibacteria group bacterium]
MAIIIKEEKSKINWFVIVVTIFLVAFIGTTIYYLFFISPPLIETVIPIRVQSLSELAQIEFNPQKIFSNPIYGALKQFIPSLSVSTTTIRINPFTP